VCRIAPNKPLELLKNVRIPPNFSYLLFHGLKCIGNGKGLFIWSFGCQRIKNIDNLQHPGGNRDGVSSKPIWITGAVELLVMMTNDGKN